jgi:hypothetical protein
MTNDPTEPKLHTLMLETLRHADCSSNWRLAMVDELGDLLKRRSRDEADRIRLDQLETFRLAVASRSSLIAADGSRFVPLRVPLKMIEGSSGSDIDWGKMSADAVVRMARKIGYKREVRHD